MHRGWSLCFKHHKIHKATPFSTYTLTTCKAWLTCPLSPLRSGTPRVGVLSVIIISIIDLYHNTRDRNVGHTEHKHSYSVTCGGKDDYLLSIMHGLLVSSTCFSWWEPATTSCCEMQIQTWWRLGVGTFSGIGKGCALYRQGASTSESKPALTNAQENLQLDMYNKRNIQPHLRR